MALVYSGYLLLMPAFYMSNRTDHHTEACLQSLQPFPPGVLQCKAAEDRAAALQGDITDLQQQLNDVQAEYTEADDTCQCRTRFCLLYRCNLERLSQQQRTGLQLYKETSLPCSSD